MKNSERIDPNTLNLRRFTLPVKCFCGECRSGKKYYECRGCSRIVPYCFGGSGDWWEYCDDCWVVLNREAEKTKSQ